MGFRGRTAGLMVGAVAVALGCSLLAAPATRCLAQDKSQGETNVSRVELVDADLQQAINAVKLQTGVEVVIEPSDKPYKKVTLSLENKPLDFVLKMMCRAAGASVRSENGVYIIGPKDAVPEPVKPADPRPVDVAPAPAEPRRPMRTEKIRLQNARPSDIVSIITRQDPSPLGALERDLLYGRVKDIASPYKEFENLRTSPIQSLNTPSVPPVVPTGPTGGLQQENNRAGEENQFGGGGRGGGLGGGGRGGGIGGGGGQGGGSSLLPDGIETVLAYELDNTIIARGSDDAIRDLKEIIRLLDIAPRQLMIKAEFIQVTQNDFRNFGIDWSVSRANLVAGNTGFASGPVFVNYATGNLVAQLRTSLTEGKGRLVSSPMVTTLNNVPVTISIGRQIPVFITSPVAAGNGTVVLQTQLQVVQATSGMFVAPRINGDDSISLFILPFVVDVAGQVTGPEGTTAPILAQQVIGPINRRIKNGDTMVIAGLATKNDGTSLKKVPLFGDLPLIGQLFQSREVRVDDTELLVFVTPSIIPERATTGPGDTTGGTLRP